jgi:hypothetical protein
MLHQRPGLLWVGSVYCFPVSTCLGRRTETKIKRCPECGRLSTFVRCRLLLEDAPRFVIGLLLCWLARCPCALLLSTVLTSLKYIWAGNLLSCPLLLSTVMTSSKTTWLGDLLRLSPPSAHNDDFFEDHFGMNLVACVRSSCSRC